VGPGGALADGAGLALTARGTSDAPRVLRRDRSPPARTDQRRLVGGRAHGRPDGAAPARPGPKEQSLDLGGVSPNDRLHTRGLPTGEHVVAQNSSHGPREATKSSSHFVLRRTRPDGNGRRPGPRHRRTTIGRSRAASPFEHAIFRHRDGQVRISRGHTPDRATRRPGGGRRIGADVRRPQARGHRVVPYKGCRAGAASVSGGDIRVGLPRKTGPGRRHVRFRRGWAAGHGGRAGRPARGCQPGRQCWWASAAGLSPVARSRAWPTNGHRRLPLGRPAMRERPREVLIRWPKHRALGIYAVETTMSR